MLLGWMLFASNEKVGRQASERITKSKYRGIKMIKGIIEFWDLGRGKQRGTFEVQGPTYEHISRKALKEFKKHLVSQNISFTDGIIYAGIRPVGNYSFKELLQNAKTKQT